MAAQGLTSTSIQWGAWAGSGMAGNDAQTRARVERSGLGLVEIPAGLAALQGLLLTGSLALVAAVPIRWERFLAKQFVGQPPPVFAAFSRPAAATAPQLGDPAFSAASGGAPAAPAAGLSAAQRGALVLEQVQDAVRAVLGTTDTSIDQPLMAAGLDSLSSVELRNSLEERLGVQLPSTLVFDYPTISSIVAFLTSKLPTTDAGDAEAGDASQFAEWRSDTEPDGGVVAARPSPWQMVVAVSSMVVRAPGNAFNCLAPVDAVDQVPASRWDSEAHTGESPCRDAEPRWAGTHRRVQHGTLPPPPGGGEGPLYAVNA